MGWGRSGACASCWEEVVPFAGPVCSRCGAQLPGGGDEPGAAPVCGACAGAETGFAALAAYGSYQGRLRGLVRALKYKRSPGLAKPLGRMIAERLTGPSLSGCPPGAFITPVPLSRSRLAARGYNQAGLLAKAVAARVGRRGMPGPRYLEALRRTRDGPPQSRLPRRERLKSQAGLYVAVRSARKALAGSTVVLVDDVFTTGATARACARALVSAGASEIYVAVVARTPSPREIAGMLRPTERGAGS